MIKNIMPEEVYEQLKSNQDLSIIDVREDDEVAKGMIPGAKHIPLGQISDRTNEIDKNKEHIMVCRSGGRSSKASEILSNEGFNVRNLVGGMTAWDAKYGQ